MYLSAFFTKYGTPTTGLTPQVTVYDLADNSTPLANQALTEVGGGWYTYNWTAYDSTKNYVIKFDSMDTTMVDSDRYKYAGDDLTVTVNVGA